MHQNFAFVCEEHFVYGVLTGFESIQVVRYYTGVLQLVLSQNIKKRSKQELNSVELETFYRQLLIDAFATVDEQYLQVKSDELSEKAVMDIELNEKPREQYPELNDRINELSELLSPGLSAVVALIHSDRLYVANIGDTRAILCKKVLTDNGQTCLRAVKLCATHDLENSSEIRRLNELGLNGIAIKQCGVLGNMSLTRCLGNLWLKNFYKDYKDLAAASQDPILAEPDVTSMAIDPSCRFLILASASLFEALDEATGKKGATDELLVKMVDEEFALQPEPITVAQAVVDQIRQLHQNEFDSSYGPTACRQIEDITLLVRDLIVNAPETTDEQQSPLEASLPKLKPLPLLSISLDESSGLVPLGESSPSTVDLEKTLTSEHQPKMSLSQGNLADVEDSPQATDDDAQIDAYVDFSELLLAYNEMPDQTKAN